MVFKRAIRYLLFTLAGLVLIVAILFGFVQTGPGKELLAKVAGSLASGNGLKVTVSGIEGFVPSQMRIERIAMADAQGTFASVEGLDLSWSPLALLNGMVSAKTLHVQKLALERQPDLPSQTDKPAQSSMALPASASADSISPRSILRSPSLAKRCACPSRVQPSSSIRRRGWRSISRSTAAMFRDASPAR